MTVIDYKGDKPKQVIENVTHIRKGNRTVICYVNEPFLKVEIPLTHTIHILIQPNYEIQFL